MIRKTFLPLVLTLVLPMAWANAQLASYSQDFESLDVMGETSLSDDGWLVYGNVFELGNFVYGYGPFIAPNSTFDSDTAGFRFSLLTTGEGDVAQGEVQLVTLSDYNNTDHANPDRTIESIFFREYTVDAADVGSTWVFQFDAANRDLVAPTTANGFIKTLDPNAGFFVTNYITADMSSIPQTWATYEVTIDIDESLVGQILQIGFDSICKEYEASGILYDNLVFRQPGGEPTVVVGETLTVMPGIQNAGGLPELEASDNLDLNIFRDPVSTAAVTQFVLSATSPTATPTTFEFTLEGNCIARPNVVQRIEFFNYITNAYEVVDERNANRTPNPDLTVVVTPTGDLSRFVDQTSRAIQTRVRYRADSPRAGFASNTDQAIWTIQ